VKRLSVIFLIVASLTAVLPGIASAWDGNWSRDYTAPEDGSQMIISGENQYSFNFKINARWKNHTGGVEGTAEFSSENTAAFYGKNNCKLTFQLIDESILVQQTAGCTYYGGMNVVFNGNYIQSE
jgi:hypothetical protein